MSAYLLSSPGFNLTNVTSSVVTQSALFCVSDLGDVCLDQGVRPGVTGVEIFGTTG